MEVAKVTSLMLFCSSLGYRASKMRQGKLSELIHNSAGQVKSTAAK